MYVLAAKLEIIFSDQSNLNFNQWLKRVNDACKQANASFGQVAHQKETFRVQLGLSVVGSKAEDLNTKLDALLKDLQAIVPIDIVDTEHQLIEF